ncbi:MAG: GNAT family N-acetyltransferase [Thermodesulfobacteriota bacterium]
MIRPFSIEDLSRILQIEHQSFPKSPYDWATFIHLHTLYPETFLVYVETLSKAKREEILGYIVFSKDGHIISIAIDPKHRRRGIGKKLVEEVLKSPWIKRVWAEVRRSNHGAQNFYLRMGFQIIGEVPNYYGNEDALVVQWFPSPS